MRLEIYVFFSTGRTDKPTFRNILNRPLCKFSYVLIAFFNVFAPCFAIKLCNINQRNAHSSNKCFNSVFDVFYIFRTSCVHHQEDGLYRQFFMVSFSCIYSYVSSLDGGRACSKPFVYKTVFLMKNPLGSKHAEDVKNRIKALI